MGKFPKSLQRKLTIREDDFSVRELPETSQRIDFFSNDYLGFARSRQLFDQTHDLLAAAGIRANGATGSRLISGNHPLYREAETMIAKFHDSPSALLFNSGYDANLGFFSSVPQRADVILYDELCHASIRDGIRLSGAKSFKFPHNDLDGLEQMIAKFASSDGEIYIATESVFSMDGDSPNLEHLCAISESFGCFLIIDEAHALGVFGDRGEGLIQSLGLQAKVFARIMTFGKGLGVHGAAVLGSPKLKEYLVNFARSFIYTTGLPPHSIAALLAAYRHLQADQTAMKNLKDNILFFNREKSRLALKPLFVFGRSAIQSAIIPGNENVKSVAKALQEKGFEVKAILSPTVRQGQERLRICLHSYNSQDEISRLLESLAQILF